MIRHAISGLATRMIEETEGPGSGRRLALPGVIAGLTALVFGVLVGGPNTGIHSRAGSIVEAVIVPHVAPTQAAADAVAALPVRRTITTARRRPLGATRPIAVTSTGLRARTAAALSRSAAPDPPSVPKPDPPHRPAHPRGSPASAPTPHPGPPHGKPHHHGRPPGHGRPHRHRPPRHRGPRRKHGPRPKPKHGPRPKHAHGHRPHDRNG